MPNNREWAIFFWLSVLIVWMLSRAELRSSLGQALRLALSPKILVPLVGLAGWASGLVVLAIRLSLWNLNLVAATCVWFFMSGLLLFFNLPEASEKPHFFRSHVIEQFTLTALLQAYLSLSVLNLFAELILQLIFTVLAALYVAAALQEQYKLVRNAVMILMTLLVSMLAIYVTTSLIVTWHHLSGAQLARQLALPMWMTGFSLPYIYAVALYAAYEVCFLRMSWAGEGSSWERYRNRLVLLAGLHLKARAAGDFVESWPRRLASASSLAEAWKVIEEFRTEQRKDQRKSNESSTTPVSSRGR